MEQILISLVVIVAFVVFLFVSGIIFFVDQQNVAIVERCGKFVDLAYPGLNFKLPAPISVIAEVANLRIMQSEHVLGIKTKDNAFIKLPVKMQIKIIEEKVKESFYKLDDPITQINSFVLNVVRSNAASLTFEDIYTKKTEIAEGVKSTLGKKIADFGYQIIDVLVDEPEPSSEVQDAYNGVIASKRELESSRNKAESRKVLLIGEAEAEAKSLELKAESYAIQRKVISQGIVDALGEFEGKAINPNAVLEFLAGIDYRDTIRDASKSDSNTLIFSSNPQEDLQKLLPKLVEKN